MNETIAQKTISRVVIYAVLVNLIAWAGSLLGGDPAQPGPGFLVWGTAPFLSALLLRVLTRDWSDFGLKPRISKNAKWYLVSLLSYPLVIAITLLVGWLTSSSAISGFSWGAFLTALLPALVIYFFFAIFEEVGWRGYLTPKLYSLEMNAFAANALVAVVWASWHLPFIRQLSSYSAEGLLSYLPRLYLGAFAFSLVYGEIRTLTGSVWPAVLLHWVGNAIANPLVAGFLILTAGREYLGSVGVDGLVMIILFGLLGVGIYRWRLRRTHGLGSPD